MASREWKFGELMGGGPTVDVVIKLVGVREGRLPRLITAITMYLVQFGSKIEVKADGKTVLPEPGRRRFSRST